MYGWTGNILHINLTTKEFEVKSPPLDHYLKYIGGRGLGGFYLRSTAHCSWKDPDLAFCIFTGPLTATISPTSGRCHMVSRSPLTGAVGSSSVGGKLGTQLKRAGLDGIVITGKANTPVGIDIRDHRFCIVDAAHLRGKDTHDTAEHIHPGRASLAVVGPAAENGVRFASITVDNYHSAGRTGLGLTLAAKGVKYILVQGSGRTRVKDKDRLKQARQDIIRLTAASPALMGQYGFSNFGTAAIYDLMDNRCMMPTDNFRATRFKAVSTLNAAAFAKAFSPEKYGCRGCHIRCKKIATRNMPGAALPEFETLSHFTALIQSSDMDLVVEANALCSRLGMDTISAASVLACRREITGCTYSKSKVLGLLRDMAMNTGEGPLLNQGAQAYARKMDQPDAAMTVKGLELPAYDPRGAYGMALAYATATRGGCHLQAYPITHEVFRKPVATDRFTFSAKARIIKIAEDLNAVADSLIACRFIFLSTGLEEYATVFTAVTGIETSAHNLLCAGERIYFNERIINHINGFSAQDDDLPPRFFTDSGTSGTQIPVPPLNREEFNTAKQTYYKIRGLDPGGIPDPQKIKTLGLD